MYTKFQLVSKYISYFFSSKNGKGHGIHSPFVFEFVTRVLTKKRKQPAYAMVERLRKNLKRNDSSIAITDFGAGSILGSKKTKRIKDIARVAAKPSKYGKLLYRMVQFYECKSILELGTSLGISTAYLALANTQSLVYTLEGDPNIAEEAEFNFNELGLQNIRVVKGNFDDTLLSVLAVQKQVDLVFIDGNHSQEPTVKYFNQLLPFIHNNTIIIFDDIHWSKSMENAWEEIKNHEQVTLSIDLFFIGIIIFRREIMAKQHFKIWF